MQPFVFLPIISELVFYYIPHWINSFVCRTIRNIRIVAYPAFGELLSVPILHFADRVFLVRSAQCNTPFFQCNTHNVGFSQCFVPIPHFSLGLCANFHIFPYLGSDIYVLTMSLGGCFHFATIIVLFCNDIYNDYSVVFVTFNNDFL